ncbi:MAG: hypothetical protein ACREMB_21325 [Candidatus Rokuibacteriota bacterium]
MSRARMDARFGPIGAGAQRLAVAGRTYGIAELMARLGIAFEGCRAIDGVALGPAHFAVRYYDPDEQRIVAYEFDGELRYLGEMRVHVAEWVGDEALQEGAAAWIWA